MKLLCWNVRGAGNLKTFRDLKDVVRLHQPEILFLPEIKCEKRRMESLKNGLKFKNCLPIDSRGLSGGLCVFWSDEVVVSVRSFSPNHIDCNISWGDKQWRFSGIYGCPKGKHKKVTW